MPKGDHKNWDHPNKKQSTRVEPIKDKEKINAIKGLLSDQPRDFLLWTLGLQTGIRATDILNLKVEDVRYLGNGDWLQIKEGKKKKLNQIFINPEVYKAIVRYNEAYPDSPDHSPLIFNLREPEKGLSIVHVANLVRKWCQTVNCKGRFGARTMRKSFVFHQIKSGENIASLRKRMGHSSEKMTREYADVSDEDVQRLCMRVL